MDNGLPLHQSKGGVDTAQLVRNRPTHRASGDDIEVQGMATVASHSAASLPPLAREPGLKRFVRRFKGEGRRVPGWAYSAHALATSSSGVLSRFGVAPPSSHLPIEHFCFRYSSKPARGPYTNCVGGAFRQVDPWG